MRFKELKKDLTTILITGLVLTAFAFAFNVDERLASYLYNPESALGWFLRQYSQMPMIVISVLFLIFILIPPIRKKYPHFRQVALIWLFALLFGAGLFVHTLLKDTIDRPRPRETVILGGTQEFTGAFGIETQKHAQAEFSGKSFPSGHVAMASILLVPYFAFRRRKPKLAYSILTAGVAYGLLVGYGRMVLGAHFFTDVVWGILCVALTASLGALFIKPQTDFKSRYTIALMILSVFCLAWFNKFTLTVHTVSESQEINFVAPCDDIQIKTTKAGEPFKASMNIKGYGGPTSWLTATNTEGTISYTTNYGIFRDLTCQAIIYKPVGTTVNFPNN